MFTRVERVGNSSCQTRTLSSLSHTNWSWPGNSPRTHRWSSTTGRRSQRESSWEPATHKVIPDTHCPLDPPLRPLSPAARPGLTLVDGCKPSSCASSYDTSCWLAASDGGYPTASAGQVSPLQRPTAHHKLSQIAPTWNSVLASFLHTCILGYLTYLHICIFAYLHTSICAYLHTWMLAYLHTCIYAYLHTCILSGTRYVMK